MTVPVTTSTIDLLRATARDIGFERMGIAAAVEPAGISGLADWLAQGYAGEMHYIEDRFDAYRHPAGVLEGARSVVMLTYPYPAGPHVASRAGVGRLARYMWSGEDYHDVIHPKLKRLRRVLLDACPEAAVRGVVDTAPLMERDFANLAGIGWQGRNTLLIDKRAGSYFFLACLVTDLVLPTDEPHEADHCGTCRRCLEACPTDAFVDAGVLDARRCISYLTIEHRGPIPLELRAGVGDWVFGCDVCQEVCPWNRKATRAAEEEVSPEYFSQLRLAELFWLDDDSFRTRFRKTPLWRARRRGVLRNAAIVLGNQGAVDAMPALRRGLGDVEPLVRGASAWAIGQIAGEEALQVLRDRRSMEADQQVRDEIDAAIAAAGGNRRSDK